MAGLQEKVQHFEARLVQFETTTEMVQQMMHEPAGRGAVPAARRNDVVLRGQDPVARGHGPGDDTSVVNTGVMNPGHLAG